MPGRNETGVCDICKREMVLRTMQEIAFRQWTDKGYVHCRVIIPVATCAGCGARNWDAAAEAIIEEAVNRETDKLP
jgi:hypothetical protein